jgi:hypothetical protein
MLNADKFRAQRNCPLGDMLMCADYVRSSLLWFSVEF